MAARLVIAEGRYTLLALRDDLWAELAVLAGGSDALLLSTRPMNEGQLEAAIEVAEDWLMPHAALLRGGLLEVVDATGRLQAGLAEVLSERTGDWSVAELEALFLRLVALATGRVPPVSLQGRHAFVADLLLLRELAHHGQVPMVRWVDPD